MVALAARRFTPGAGFKAVVAQGSLAIKLLRQITTQLRFSMRTVNLFDCATGHVVLSRQSEKGRAMIETVTALLGLVSAGIFLAHALDGLRSRA